MSKEKSLTFVLCEKNKQTNYPSHPIKNLNVGLPSNISEPIFLSPGIMIDITIVWQNESTCTHILAKLWMDLN